MTTAKSRQAKQQRRLERKRKAAEKQKTKLVTPSQKLQKKIAQNELFRNMTMIDGNKAEVKMSAVFLDFLDPYKQFATSRQAFEKLVTTGLVAWNLAIIDDKAKQEADIEKFAETFDSETAEDFRGIIAQMMERKQQHFAQHKRLILEYQVTETADNFHLSVASTPE